MNRTEPISDELRGPDGLEAQHIWTESSILAQMAYEDIESFNELATIAKKALAA